MNKNPYRDMRKRKVEPIEKGSILRQAATAIGIEERGNAGKSWDCDPERAKRLLKIVLGEENLKHVHIKSSNRHSPEFEIDGITLAFHQGKQVSDDYFLAAYGVMDDELPVRSMADLGSALMLCLDVLTDDPTDENADEYSELYSQMQICYLGLDEEENSDGVTTHA
ncbi:MAG: hypothetical protein L6461_21590 [Anaerolineae bacterium]|nr:hypothetical protein [Anaerolineae bacterium]